MMNITVYFCGHIPATVPVACVCVCVCVCARARKSVHARVCLASACEGLVRLAGEAARVLVGRAARAFVGGGG